MEVAHLRHQAEPVPILGFAGVRGQQFGDAIWPFLDRSQHDSQRMIVIDGVVLGQPSFDAACRIEAVKPRAGPDRRPETVGKGQPGQREMRDHIPLARRRVRQRAEIGQDRLLDVEADARLAQD